MLNLGSYNYLGFADDWGSTCKTGVMPILDKQPVGVSINRKDYGKTFAGCEESKACGTGRIRRGNLMDVRRHVLPYLTHVATCRICKATAEDEILLLVLAVEEGFSRSR